MKKGLGFAWIFAVLLLTAVVFVSGGHQVRLALSSLQLWHVVVLAVLQLLTIGLLVYQWQYMLQQRKESVGFWQIMVVYLAGNFVEGATPSVRLGGEAAKVYLSGIVTGLPFQVVTGLLVEKKFLSMASFALVCTVALSWTVWHHQLPALVYTSLLVLISLLVGFFYWWRRLGRRGETGFVQTASRESRNLLSASQRRYVIYLSIVVWVLYPVKAYLASRMLGFDIPFAPVLAATYTAYLLGLLPLFPGGLGSFEAGMTLVLSAYGLQAADSLAVALTLRLATYWIPLLLSALCAAYVFRWAAERTGGIKVAQ